MNKTFLIFISIVICFIETNAQDKIISIWPNLAPGTENINNEEALNNERIYKIYQPDLRIFKTPKQNKSRGGVLILPGGGYSHITIVKEGYKVAEWLNSLGLNAFVLKYRLNENWALDDVERAMSFIKQNANEYNLDTTRLGVIGFSAGGHLALNLAENYSSKVFKVKDRTDSISSKPNFLILLYPAADDLILNEKLKNLSTTFIVHSADDKRVPIEYSLKIFSTLKLNGIPVELHAFNSGGHGFGLGIQHNQVSQWPDLCKHWMISEGILIE